MASMASPDAPHGTHPGRCRITSRSTGTRIGARVFAKDPAMIGVGSDPWRVRLTPVLGLMKSIFFAALLTTSSVAADGYEPAVWSESPWVS